MSATNHSTPTGMVAAENPYDRFPYRTRPNAHARPDRLSAIRILYGIAPVAASGCRMLEIGCGDGGHLVPLAGVLPGASFTGVDLAPGAIASAARSAERAGVANARFLQADIRALPRDLGRFDYIVAHGVYSWIPADARDALLAAVAAMLEPGGVAFISFDALPGGHLRHMVRDILRFHTEAIGEPRRRIEEARALIELLTRADDREGPANVALRIELREAAARSDQALEHDDLALVHASHFHEFIGHAASHGLSFVADADPTVSAETGLSVETRATLATLDRIAREQYLDFLRCRRFRQALVCHAEQSVALVPESIDSLHVLATGTLASRLMSGEQAFSGESARALADPARRLLEIAAASWPSSVPVAKLDVRMEVEPAEIRPLVLEAYASGLLDLVDGSIRVAAAPGRFPCAPVQVRQRAADDEPIVNLHHRTVRLDHPDLRKLIALLDGTRDLVALQAAWTAQSGTACSEAWLRARLADLTRLAVLAG